ncbi:MAG: DUF4861 family protein, partial [Candidatus Hodarchaeales archaeon]
MTIAKAGPVRIVIQTESGIGYNGKFGVAEDLKARRTFVLYNDIPGIVRNLQLVGEDAVDAYKVGMTDIYGGPLDFASKFVDLGMNTSVTPWVPKTDSNGFDMLYSPDGAYSADNNSRYQPNRDLLGFMNLTEVTTPWVGMYSSSSENGYVVNIGQADYIDTLYSIDWWDGELAIKYAFERFPLEGVNQILIPVNGSDVTTTVGALMDALNEPWTREYSIALTSNIDEIPPSEPSPGTGTQTIMYKVADFEIIADSYSGDLAAGTPIIIKADDFPLTRSKLNTAMVKDGTTDIATQADDLDGDGWADEIVFKLQSVLTIGSSKTFTLYVENQGNTNGLVADTALKVANEKRYNATYDDWLPTSLSASHMNGSTTSSLVDE